MTAHELPESLGPTMRKLGKSASGNAERVRRAERLRAAAQALDAERPPLSWHQAANGVLVAPVERYDLLRLLLDHAQEAGELTTSRAPISYPQGGDKPVDGYRPVGEADTRAPRSMTERHP